MDLIFGTFKILSRQEKKDNAIYLCWLQAFFALVAGAVALGVCTGRPELASLIYACIFVLYLLLSRKIIPKYTPQFGFRYNVLRMIIALLPFYRGTLWHSFMAFYNYLHFNGIFPGSTRLFGFLSLAISIALLLTAYISLNRTRESRVADLLGLAEALGLLLTLGSVTFLIIYG